MDTEIYEKRRRTVCFTGHRNLPKGEEERRALSAKIDAVIIAAYSKGYREFIAGGAIGFDTVAACRVIVAKRRLCNLKLRLALPCRNQTEKWSDVKDLAIYKKVMESADSIEYITDFYTDSCMHDRNKFMVGESGLCIAYCTRPRSGTASTISYAEKQGLGIINLGEESFSVSEFDRFSAEL